MARQKIYHEGILYSTCCWLRTGWTRDFTTKEKLKDRFMYAMSARIRQVRASFASDAAPLSFSSVLKMVSLQSFLELLHPSSVPTSRC